MLELIDFRLMRCLDITDKDRLNDKTISDRWIKLFIKQCPCCQVMSRAHLAIRTHPFTCAAYYPIEVLALDHIGPLVIDKKATLRYYYSSGLRHAEKLHEYLRVHKMRSLIPVEHKQ